MTERDWWEQLGQLSQGGNAEAYRFALLVAADWFEEQGGDKKAGALRAVAGRDLAPYMTHGTGPHWNGMVGVTYDWKRLREGQVPAAYDRFARSQIPLDVLRELLPGPGYPSHWPRSNDVFREYASPVDALEALADALIDLGPEALGPAQRRGPEAAAGVAPGKARG